MRKYIFLFSLKAGHSNFKKLENEILTSFKNKNKLNQLEIIKTEDENSISKFSKDISQRDGENILIICGGDGSLHEALAGVLGTNTILTAYPMGTGNDFLRNFKKIKSIDDFFNLEINKIDTIKVNNHYAINSISIGLDVNVVRGANALKNKYPWLRLGAYQLSAINNIINNKVYPLDILLENEEEAIHKSGDFTLVAISNGQFYGGGFRNAPLAKVNDGLLDVTIADAYNRRELVSIVTKYRKGNHLEEKGVFHKRFTKATIKSLSSKDLYLNADGEIYREKEWNIEILPKSLLWASVR